MPAYTLTEAQDELNQWKAALAAVKQYRSYTMSSGREVRFQDLPEIRSMIDYFAREVERATRSNRRPIRHIIPLDT